MIGVIQDLSNVVSMLFNVLSEVDGRSRSFNSTWKGYGALTARFAKESIIWFSTLGPGKPLSFEPGDQCMGEG